MVLKERIHTEGRVSFVLGGPGFGVGVTSLWLLPCLAGGQGGDVLQWLHRPGGHTHRGTLRFACSNTADHLSRPHLPPHTHEQKARGTSPTARWTCSAAPALTQASLGFWFSVFFVEFYFSYPHLTLSNFLFLPFLDLAIISYILSLGNRPVTAGSKLEKHPSASGAHLILQNYHSLFTKGPVRQYIRDRNCPQPLATSFPYMTLVRPLPAVSNRLQLVYNSKHDWALIWSSFWNSVSHL